MHDVWARALARRQHDPEGAIIMARTVLETVCKRVLDHAEGTTCSETDELPALYAKAADRDVIAALHPKTGAGCRRRGDRSATAGHARPFRGSTRADRSPGTTRPASIAFQVAAGGFGLSPRREGCSCGCHRPHDPSPSLLAKRTIDYEINNGHGADFQVDAIDIYKEEKDVVDPKARWISGIFLLLSFFHKSPRAGVCHLDETAKASPCRFWCMAAMLAHPTGRYL